MAGTGCLGSLKEGGWRRGRDGESRVVSHLPGANLTVGSSEGGWKRELLVIRIQVAVAKRLYGGRGREGQSAARAARTRRSEIKTSV